MSAITTEQYDYVMGLRKRFSDDDTLDLGSPWSKELISLDERESFLLDHYRSMVEFKKLVLNERYRTTVVLARLCTLKRHTNPDGTVFPAAHVHLYDEEHGLSLIHI